MHYVVNTGAMMAEGLLSPDQGAIIKARSRAAMVALAVNSVLCAGIMAAGLGFVFWLADAAMVTVAGMLFLLVGCGVLLKGGVLYRMFGNAASLIGAVMLVAGAALKLAEVFDAQTAGPLVLGLGGAVAMAASWVRRNGPEAVGFVAASVLVLGAAAHLFGLGVWLDGAEGSGMALAWGYAALVIAAVGWLVDVRFLTALALVPFAQMLDTGTFYFHASYVFYSPESTLSILQMAALIGLCLWGRGRVQERTARHLGILAIMALVVMNLCFLVGSLWGEVVGSSYVRDAYYAQDGSSWQGYREAMAAFRAKTLVIADWVYAIAYAAVLAAGVFRAAHKGNRGLFNTLMVFAAIHGYTQVFESLYDEPLAYVIGGLVAVPLAWGMWRLDARFRV